MTLAVGTRLGPYEILSLVGQGGMGEVHRARDGRLDRIVAIKILPTDVANHLSRLARFEREARVAASLSHPHICAVYDTGRDGDCSYLITEYLEGETSRRALKANPPRHW